ncbi:MAG TPA: hypothetical protein VF416_07385 [Marmoricola sp.]
MSVADTIAADSRAARRRSPGAPHVHEWALRAVEFDTWGQVSLYECLGCPRVRYA